MPRESYKCTCAYYLTELLNKVNREVKQVEKKYSVQALKLSGITRGEEGGQSLSMDIPGLLMDNKHTYRVFH